MSNMKDILNEWRDFRKNALKEEKEILNEQGIGGVPDIDLDFNAPDFFSPEKKNLSPEEQARVARNASNAHRNMKNEFEGYDDPDDRDKPDKPKAKKKRQRRISRGGRCIAKNLVYSNDEEGMKLLQTHLNGVIASDRAWGDETTDESYKVPPVEEDGACGNKTKTAIRQFQKTFNLKPDGVVGPETAKKLLQHGGSGEEYAAYKTKWLQSPKSIAAEEGWSSRAWQDPKMQAYVAAVNKMDLKQAREHARTMKKDWREAEEDEMPKSAETYALGYQIVAKRIADLSAGAEEETEEEAPVAGEPSVR